VRAVDVVVVDGLIKVYGDRRVVDGVSFKVRSGEIFGLVGPNGAGKTTTLRMIATLVKPNEGRVLINGVDALAKPVEARRSLSYLPEEAEVYPRLTGYEHMLFHAKLKCPNNYREAVNYGAQLSGLGDRLHDKAGEYSKGMKRRLLIAIALMTRPQVAILDEPTSGLDVYASYSVRKVIRKYSRESNAAVIISSHNMLEVEHLCDRVAFINNGKIIDSGTPIELMNKYSSVNMEEAFIKAIEASTI